MTTSEIAQKQGCYQKTVVKNLQDGGVFHKQESRNIGDQTVNPKYERYMRWNGYDYEWTGSTIEGKQISAIARG